MPPLLPSKISTNRLTLIRLTNTTPSHPHVQLFHENWSDPTATAWSLHGATTSLAESREWMIEHLSRFDTCFYAVFAQKHDGQGVEKVWSTRDVRQLQEGETEGEAEGEEELGIHVGSVSLRLQPDGPTLPSPSSPSPLHPNPKQNPLDLRVLGYAFFASTWGKGYATEANRGLLDAYAAAVAQYKSESESESNEEQGKTYYVEAAVDEDNPASEKVLCKLGFERVGWKDEGEDKVWLNGAWRGPGYWVYGMYV